jgi:hypothetical protein
VDLSELGCYLEIIIGCLGLFGRGSIVRRWQVPLLANCSSLD